MRLIVQGLGSSSTSFVQILRCSMCAEWARPTTPRPGKVLADGVQPHEIVQMDLFHLPGADGAKEWFMATVDVATDRVIVRRVGDLTPKGLWTAWQECWLSWAEMWRSTTMNKESLVKRSSAN